MHARDWGKRVQAYLFADFVFIQSVHAAARARGAGRARRGGGVGGGA